MDRSHETLVAAMGRIRWVTSLPDSRVREVLALVIGELKGRASASDAALLQNAIEMTYDLLLSEEFSRQREPPQ
jgi:hypothetical protein